MRLNPDLTEGNLMEMIKQTNGTKFRETVYFGKKRVRSPLFLRKSDAKKWKVEQLKKRDSLRTKGINLDDQITTSELAERWLLSCLDNAERTRQAYESIVRLHVLPAFGNLELADLKLTHGEKLKSSLIRKGLSPSRINNILRVTNVFLNYGVKHQHLSENPFRLLSRVKVQDREITYWSSVDIGRFLSSNKDWHYYPLFLLALTTGTRKGEICGLCWDCVDFERNRIVVKRSRDRFGLKENTKGNSVRVLPMVSELKEELFKIKANATDLRFVFTTPKGKPVSYEHLADRIFNKGLKRSKVRKIRFHDLRTTFASNFMMNGGNIYTLKKLLGHTSVRVTEESYADLSLDFLEDQKTVHDLLPKAFGNLLELVENRKTFSENIPNISHGTDLRLQSI